MDLETLRRMENAPNLEGFEGTLETKLTVGRKRKPGKLIFENGRIEFSGFGFWPALNEEIKAMYGHRWHGYDDTNPRKRWSVKDCRRNRFQLAYLMGGNPFRRYDSDLPPAQASRPLYPHQLEMLAHILHRRQCIFACEMGTGKTLVFIEAAEQSNCKEIWYVGPRAGVRAVGRELLKWKAKFKPRMLTYDGMKKAIREWQSGAPAPDFVCFDECSKLKTPTSQTSKAALHLANAMRDEHGEDAYILLMSGTPAPKTPVDWWHQCEVACPGFIREGDHNKFSKRLQIVEMRPSISGGQYPHRVAWLDDERRCATCGLYPEDHTMAEHAYQKSKDEIGFLYKRMRGLVLVKFKKDCLELPEKQYEVIRVKPTIEIMRAAKLIKAKSTRAITALTLMREISDGFQYAETPSGTEPCLNCFGRKEVTVPVPKEGVDIMAPQEINKDDYDLETVVCDNCNGTGETTVYRRETQAVGSPKDAVFIDELDAHEDVGRYIVWGGFTGTLDRLVGIAHQQGWATLRVDGKGYKGTAATGENIDADILLDALDRSHPNYKDLLEKYPKVCFVGHPQAGGMALTLTSSPTEMFYSNCFNGEARMQAEDRAHRPGMDANRGLRIVDLIMMPSDQLVLDNLKTKKKLQNLTMGQLQDAFTRGMND